MATAVQAQLCRSLEPFSEGETFNHQDGLRNNKQAHEPASQLVLDLGASFQSDSGSVQVYSLPDFEIAKADDPGNKPFDGSQNNHDLATLRNLVSHGAYNPFEFGERRGYGLQKIQKDPGLVFLGSRQGQQYPPEDPEDCILQELLNVRMAPPLPPHQSMQMVVEECSHLDPSRVGGHSNYASKPFDNLSDSYMLRKETEWPAQNHLIPNSGTISFMIESLATEPAEDVQIPDNCELLSDRMRHIKSGPRIQLLSPFSSKANSTASSINQSPVIAPIIRLPKQVPDHAGHQKYQTAAAHFGSQGKQSQLMSQPRGDSLYSMIQSQVISLKTKPFLGMPTYSK